MTEKKNTIKFPERPLTATERKELKEVIVNDFEFIREDLQFAIRQIKANLKEELKQECTEKNKAYAQELVKIRKKVAKLNEDKAAEKLDLERKLREIDNKYYDKMTPLKEQEERIVEDVKAKGLHTNVDPLTGVVTIQHSNLDIVVNEEFNKRYPEHHTAFQKIRREENEAHKSLLTQNVTSSNVSRLLGQLPTTESLLGLTSSDKKMLKQ
jgi:asparagine synthetase B (glutamine-hydrolysing)